MTFNEIIKANPQAGELAMEMVYEKLTGKCWHLEGKTNTASLPDGVCKKCGLWYEDWEKYPNIKKHPDLLHSLDAWVPLWKLLSDEQKERYYNALNDMWTEGVYQWEYEPPHHLEAALRTLEGDCSECGGTGCKLGYRDEDGWPSNPCASGCNITQKCTQIIICTCTNGKVSLYELWERKVSQ